MHVILARSALGPRLLTSVAISLAILALAYVAESSWQTTGASQSITVSGASPDAQPRPGSLAPDFQATMLDGTSVHLSDLRGKPVWVSFWASWCPPCRAENPDVDAIYRQMKDRGLAMIAVDMGESPAEIKSYLASTGYAFPIALDTDRAITNLYQVYGIPTHYFIDRSGRIVDMQIGVIDKDATLARIEKLLGP